jgi:CubicO group peptidase (beta-lactamase class C family)
MALRTNSKQHVCDIARKTRSRQGWFWRAVVAAVAPAVLSAQSPASFTPPSDFVSQAAAYMKGRASLREFTFSGAILVVHEGRVLYREAFGLADREYGIPNTIETRFRTGSAGKQFTAAAILLLEDRGKLKVTDPVSKYLPEWPQAWSAMTIHHLLSHTGGLPRLTTEGLADVSGLSAAAPKPFARFSDLLKSREELQPPDFQPGTKWAYSNVGYLILGMIVEKASGVPYADFMREQVFDPIGMRNTRVDDPNALVPARARGYRRAQDRGTATRSSLIRGLWPRPVVSIQRLMTCSFGTMSSIQIVSCRTRPDRNSSASSGMDTGMAGSLAGPSIARLSGIEATFLDS